MKNLFNLSGICIAAIFLTACTIGNGMICGPQTPRAYCDKEAYERLAHPKTYGEYFEKPGMSKESWRVDWVACGGRNNGQYTSGPRKPEDKDDFESMRRQSTELKSCMQNKGYEYRSNP